MNKFVLIQMIGAIFFSSFQGMMINHSKISPDVNQGVDITYEVTVTAPPEAGIEITATYSNISSPLRLQIGYDNWSIPTLAMLTDLQFNSPDGEDIPWIKLNDKTIEVSSLNESITANYNLDLTKVGRRGTKVSSIGGVINGYEAFPVPGNQKVNSVKVKFNLPEPWTAVSPFSSEADWFEVKPFTYEDLSLETKASGWYFGNVDFDQTKTYPDGFEIRVVGFKNFSYEHWDVYMEDSPLDEALKSADFYHETYLKLKGLYGEFPLPTLLLVGPGYWQARSTYLRQQMVGWYRYEYIPHHMIHAYYGIQGSRIDFSGRSYNLLGEGYTTYSEGIMSAEISGDPFLRGMLFERKFHYLRGIKFNNMQQNSSQYVLGFIVTYLMDQEIKKETNGQKGIDDLMVSLWQKYNTPNYSSISDEQFLQTLKELTGNDWQWFYNQNMINTGNLNVDALDDLKGDFNEFVKVVSDYWYNGYPSLYFIGQEIVSAVGDFDMNVRMQDPMGTSPNFGDFVIAALKYMGTTQSDLKEDDVEAILHQVTGKDHSDFFEFYRSQGFEIDPKEITEAVKTFTFGMWGMDNAVKLTPNIFPLGQSTSVVGELVDPDFANAKDLLLQVQVFAPPTGLTNTMDLITGKEVSFQFEHEFSDGGIYGAGSNYIFSLPIIKIEDKTYTFFTVNLPEEDAGVILYSFVAKNAEPTINDHLGGFIGTKKVSFQSNSTIIVKPANFNLIDDSPPLLSITQPAEYEIATQATSFCVRGLVEPEASVELNGIKATISTNLFKFNGCVDLLPGRNLIEVKASDNSGNITTQEIIVNSPDVATPTPQITATNPVITTESPQRPSLSTWKLVILLMIIILVIGSGFLIIKRNNNK